jgi:hypothetical protein
MAKRAQVSSVWWCELCQVQIWQPGRPPRVRCRWCRHWMDFVREFTPDPTEAAQLRAALLAAVRARRPPPPARP